MVWQFPCFLNFSQFPWCANVFPSGEPHKVRVPAALTRQVNGKSEWRCFSDVLMDGQPTPPLTYPPEKYGFNKALFLGGGHVGGKGWAPNFQKKWCFFSQVSTLNHDPVFQVWNTSSFKVCFKSQQNWLWGTRKKLYPIPWDWFLNRGII